MDGYVALTALSFHGNCVSKTVIHPSRLVLLLLFFNLELGSLK